ncbi:MAG TPA: sulfatase-like hydrolase/transferase, partial [Bryobacteraceae bacterium]|nr:sulfatase-like hydrolase/transferase [Bryobacteraceae bacterium]
MDWNYLAQKTSAILVWTVTFAVVYRIVSGRPIGNRPQDSILPHRDWTLALLVVAVGVLLAHRGLGAVQPKADLGRYAGYNASYKVLYDWLAPREGDGDYYHLLAANTNLPRERKIEPVEVRLSDRLTGAGGARPNIFVFVVDSLRRDYLEPFNPKVAFTPGVASFARESVVFENAFTRYAGTGLSEPSIWSGALLPHKQYVTPFHPMDSLEKLLDACGYQRFITVDTILGSLLTPGPKTTELDQGTLTMDLDLAHTVRELEAKLKNRTAADGPVFAYTQPQNLHISVINRANRSVPDGESFPGFNAPYASRVKHVDAAFGEFIGFLKSKGWYDTSIVVLAADHGDSLGEDGRWGHAYTLVPEVMRIPLIVHVPAAVKGTNVFDAHDVAFLTDIAPSLYQLLGQGPLRKEEVYGKSLFAPDAAALTAERRDDWLMVASYAPIYGILHRGRELYVSDGVQYREFLYDLSGGGSRAVELGATTRRTYQDLIRRDIQALRTYYRMDTHE